MFQMKTRPFRRIKEEAEIAGVCAGLAYSFGMHVAAVRFLVLLAVFLHPATIVGYFLMSMALAKWAQSPTDYARVVHKAPGNN